MAALLSALAMMSGLWCTVGPAAAVVVTDFESAGAVQDFTFTGPGSAASSVKLPTGGVVLGASVNVSGLPANGTGNDYPLLPILSLNGTEVWRFDGTGAGALGHQTIFSDGTDSAQVNVTTATGLKGSASILLPAGAFIQDASVRLLGDTGVKPTMLAVQKNLTGEKGSDGFGHVASVGDFDGDGYSDLAVGAPGASTSAGRVYLYLGGADPDKVADGKMDGGASWDRLGDVVAGAGDLNGDGYADIVMGSPWNGSGGAYAGAAYVCFGGPNPDLVADLTFTGHIAWDMLGTSVAAAGDVNKDGFDDLLVGAPGNDSAASDAGRAYLYFGGSPMNTVPDLTIDGPKAASGLGVVAGAGDVNGDGFADMMVGAPGYDTGALTNVGRAYLFFGRSPMSSVPDLTFTGSAGFDDLGGTLVGPGDVDGDGFDDILVSAPDRDGGGKTDSGVVYLYHGGAAMDSVVDLTFTGAQWDHLQAIGAGNGDVDGDGFDDILLGAPYYDTWSKGAGSAFVYFGGKAMDTVADKTFVGPKAGDYLGKYGSISRDANGDGLVDIILGADGNDSAAVEAGIANLYLSAAPANGPALDVEGVPAWVAPRLTGGVTVLLNLTDPLEAAIANGTPGTADSWGNRFVTLRLNLSATIPTNFTITNTSITYRHTQSVQLTDAVARIIEGRPAGSVQVPFLVSVASAGTVRLDALRIEIDEAPRVIMPGNLRFPEDSRVDGFLDLRTLFTDDYTSPANLTYTLQPGENASIVNVSIAGGGSLLSVDAATGPANDNWTGRLTFSVTATDERGLSVVAGPVLVLVENVNDAPMFTSSPPRDGVVGEPYAYNATATDGDHDALLFTVQEGPAGMTVNGTTGTVRWTPAGAEAGNNAVTLSVTDGIDRELQVFTVHVSQPPNLRPTAALVAPTNGTTVPRVDVLLSWRVSDPESDPVASSVYLGTDRDRVAALDPSTSVARDTAGTSFAAVGLQPGAIYHWTVIPADTGGSGLSTSGVWSFTVPSQAGSNHPPSVTSLPPPTAMVGEEYRYDVDATDTDGDPLTFRLVTGPAGMTIDPASGILRWTPSSAGLVRVEVAVADPWNSTFQVLFVTVRSTATIADPRVTFLSPADGAALAGVSRIAGLASTDPSRRVVSVELAVDGGAWRQAAGNVTWTLDIDTRGLSDGPHRITARAWDGTVYSAEAVVNVTVANAAPQSPPPRVIRSADSLMTALIAILAIVAAGAIMVAVAARRRRPPTGSDALPTQAPPVPLSDGSVDEGGEQSEARESGKLPTQPGQPGEPPGPVAERSAAGPPPAAGERSPAPAEPALLSENDPPESGTRPTTASTRPTAETNPPVDMDSEIATIINRLG